MARGRREEGDLRWGGRESNKTVYIHLGLAFCPGVRAARCLNEEASEGEEGSKPR